MTIQPNYNPSMALLGGWPWSQTAGDGNLGNHAANETNAAQPPAAPTNILATELGNAQAEGAAEGGRAGRII